MAFLNYSGFIFLKKVNEKPKLLVFDLLSFDFFFLEEYLKILSFFICKLLLLLPFKDLTAELGVLRIQS